MGLRNLSKWWVVLDDGAEVLAVGTQLDLDQAYCSLSNSASVASAVLKAPGEVLEEPLAETKEVASDMKPFVEVVLDVVVVRDVEVPPWA